jgi:beta-lactamase class D
MKNFFATVIFMLASQAHAIDAEQNTELDRIFNEAGVKGTFVLYDVSANRHVTHNLLRAEQRFTPASTFKIPNSLIGLTTGSVKSVDEVLPYGGKPQPFKSWEQDMGLRDAIRVSNVPVYQELARRIGLERMRDSLAAIPYGNGEIGSEVDTFWLKGPLKISAMEQTVFLAKLAEGTLPFPPDAQRSVREIAKLEQKDNRVLYGKSGWLMTAGVDIGWWVGWVTSNGQIFSFALNIDMPDRSYVAKRIELGKACLRELGVF